MCRLGMFLHMSKSIEGGGEGGVFSKEGFDLHIVGN